FVFEDGVGGGFGGRFDGGVFEEVAELALAAVTDLGLQGDGVLGDFVDFTDALGGEGELGGELFGGGLTAGFHHQFFRAAEDLVDRFDHVDGDADRAGL